MWVRQSSQFWCSSNWGNQEDGLLHGNCSDDLAAEVKAIEKIVFFRISRTKACFLHEEILLREVWWTDAGRLHHLLKLTPVTNIRFALKMSRAYEMSNSLGCHVRVIVRVLSMSIQPHQQKSSSQELLDEVVYGGPPLRLVMSTPWCHEGHACISAVAGQMSQDETDTINVRGCWYTTLWEHLWWQVWVFGQKVLEVVRLCRVHPEVSYQERVSKVCDVWYCAVQQDVVEFEIVMYNTHNMHGLHTTQEVKHQASTLLQGQRCGWWVWQLFIQGPGPLWATYVLAHEGQAAVAAGRAETNDAICVGADTWAVQVAALGGLHDDTRCRQKSIPEDLHRHLDLIIQSSQVHFTTGTTTQQGRHTIVPNVAHSRALEDIGDARKEASVLISMAQHHRLHIFGANGGRTGRMLGQGQEGSWRKNKHWSYVRYAWRLGFNGAYWVAL